MTGRVRKYSCARCIVTHRSRSRRRTPSLRKALRCAYWRARDEPGDGAAEDLRVLDGEVPTAPGTRDRDQVGGADVALDGLEGGHARTGQAVRRRWDRFRPGPWRRKLPRPGPLGVAVVDRLAGFELPEARCLPPREAVLASTARVTQPRHRREASIRTVTCPCPGAGVGRSSSTNGSPNFLTTAAFMSPPPASHIADLLEDVTGSAVPSGILRSWPAGVRALGTQPPARDRLGQPAQCPPASRSEIAHLAFSESHAGKPGPARPP